jgi:hypothetical protein
MMTRLLARLLLLLSLLLAGAAIFPQLRAYDADGLRALLLDTGCTAPCFLGIRPQVTTQNEAIAILEAHPWVKKVLYTAGGHTRGAITWDWNGTQPDWLAADRTGLIQTQGGVVQNNSVQTGLKLGDIWLSFGQPEQTLIYRIYYPTSIHQFSFYESSAIQFRGVPACPLSTAEFWNAPQAVSLPVFQAAYMIEVEDYNWLELNRRFCQP